MTSDVLFAELMKQALCVDCDCLATEKIPANCSFTRREHNWVFPVSAVTEWRMKAAQKLKDWFDNEEGHQVIDRSEARRLTFEAIDKVLGVKP